MSDNVKNRENDNKNNVDETQSTSGENTVAKTKKTVTKYSKSLTDFPTMNAYLSKLINENETGKPKQISDASFKSSDLGNIQVRNKTYNSYLKSYVDNFNERSKHQRSMKKWFFVITMSLLVIIVLASFGSLFCVSQKESLEAADVAAVITAIGGAIASFLVLPKIIGDNLFPSKEDDQTHAIFSKMVEYDMSLREFHNHSSYSQKQNNEGVVNKLDVIE